MSIGTLKIKRAYVLAAMFAVLIILWFLINSLGSDDNKTMAPPITKSDVLPVVTVQNLTATPHAYTLSLHGQTEPNREVSVKAETAGLVVKTPIKEGQKVTRGTLLCAQDVDARGAMLDQAKAQLKSRELDLAAAQTLVEKGFRSSTQAAAAKAARDGALANVKQAEIELGNVEMRAPFSGIFEKQMAELGDYLAPGQACGLLVDLDPIIVIGNATETQISNVKVGDTAKAVLATGQSVEGIVRFVENRANPATRTFRIEVEVPNPEGALKAGVSGTIRLATDEILAHLIPSEVLTLNDTGNLGVRYVDYGNKVRFASIETIDDSPNGVWVTGLPDQARIIVRGQDYVTQGIEVEVDLSTETYRNAGG